MNSLVLIDNGVDDRGAWRDVVLVYALALMDFLSKFQLYFHPIHMLMGPIILVDIHITLEFIRSMYGAKWVHWAGWLNCHWPYSAFAFALCIDR